MFSHRETKRKRRGNASGKMQKNQYKEPWYDTNTNIRNGPFPPCICPIHLALDIYTNLNAQD